MSMFCVSSTQSWSEIWEFHGYTYLFILTDKKKSRDKQLYKNINYFPISH